MGNYVGRGESNRLATISQVDPINVVFGISEALYLRTVDKVDRKALERIDLILPDNSQYAFRGRYTNIGRALDEKTGTLQIEAQFPNPKGLLFLECLAACASPWKNPPVRCWSPSRLYLMLRDPRRSTS